MKNLNLSKIEDRKKYINIISRDAEDVLKSEFNFSPYMRIKLDFHTISIYTISIDDDGNEKTDFGSEISIYMDRKEMNYSTSGSFNPIEEEVRKWYCTHLSTIANNWEEIFGILEFAVTQLKVLQTVEVSK